jgi:hypothetical protein
MRFEFAYDFGFQNILYIFLLVVYGLSLFGEVVRVFNYLVL